MNADSPDPTGAPERAGPEARFSHVTPILRVADYERSVAYYVDVLGFTLDWGDGQFGSVSRDRASFMLCEGSQGCSSTWVWLAVGDADAVHDELVRRGARIRNPPTNYPWGSREVHVFDADGHVLRLASDAPRGAPLGTWLDEAGVRWQPQADGSWTRVESP